MGAPDRRGLQREVAVSPCRILSCTDVAEPSEANVAAVFLHEVICRCRYKDDSFLEFIQWKNTQVSDIYRLYKRIQFLNRQKSPKGTVSLSFLVLLVLLLNFSGAFDSLVVD